MRCPLPPPLPPNYVCRQHLLDEMVSKLCQSTIDPDSYGTSLTVTGAGGFGKTSIVIALCHHSVIKEQFKDGVVFIELGPQATDPSMKLSQLYHLLTGEDLKQGDINHTEQEIKQLSNLCRNLLVIIDDVWHVEDAEPIVKAFSNCKIVLTTRMNDIEQYIPTKQVVSVGPMEQSEANLLLTSGVIDIGQLSQEDVNLLDELAQDVHLWPLLLSLVRGQLSHNVNNYKLCYNKAIQSVAASLHDKGLTAFDKNNIVRSRKYAVKICIEVTLRLLTKSLSDKIKTLLLWTGIGTSMQIDVLHCLWNVSKQEATSTVDALWTYGLLLFTGIAMPPLNKLKRCVEVHAVISQYIIESMESREYSRLSPLLGLNTIVSIAKELDEQSIKDYAFNSNLCNISYLKYFRNRIENHVLPSLVKTISTMTTTDPHKVMLTLQNVLDDLIFLPDIVKFLPSFIDEMKSLISDSHKTLKNSYKMLRKWQQNVQRCLSQKNYNELIQAAEAYVSIYPISVIAHQGVTMVKKVIPYCDGNLLDYITENCELLQMMTPKYHPISLHILPYIKFSIKELKRINSSLHTGSPDIKATIDYFQAGKHSEERHMLKVNCLIKLQEVAPNYVQRQSQNLYASL